MTVADTNGEVRANWGWLSLIPFGLGGWAPVYACVRARDGRWCALGAAWSLIALAGWIVAIANNGGAAGGLLIDHPGLGGRNRLIVRDPWFDPWLVQAGARLAF